MEISTLQPPPDTSHKYYQGVFRGSGTTKSHRVLFVLGGFSAPVRISETRLYSFLFCNRFGTVGCAAGCGGFFLFSNSQLLTPGCCSQSCGAAVAVNWSPHTGSPSARRPPAPLPLPAHRRRTFCPSIRNGHQRVLIGARRSAIVSVKLGRSAR